MKTIVKQIVSLALTLSIAVPLNSYSQNSYFENYAFHGKKVMTENFFKGKKTGNDTREATAGITICTEKVSEEQLKVPELNQNAVLSAFWMIEAEESSLEIPEAASAESLIPSWKIEAVEESLEIPEINKSNYSLLPAYMQEASEEELIIPEVKSYKEIVPAWLITAEEPALEVKDIDLDWL